MADNSWVSNDELGVLYATAQAMGADTFVLSNEVRTRAYVATKNNTAASAGKFTFKNIFDISNHILFIIYIICDFIHRFIVWKPYSCDNFVCETCVLC